MHKFILAGVFSLLLTAAAVAPVSAAASKTKEDKQQIKTEKVCNRLEDKAAKPKLLLEKNTDKLNSLTTKITDLCPAPASVTIATDGCSLTANGPVGSILKYGAHTADGMRGMDAEPLTIPSSGTLTVLTGAAKDLIVYGTVFDTAGKQLATASATVTATLCSIEVPNGGYPDKWALAPISSLIDDWGHYNRQATSYVAFKLASTGNPMPYGFGSSNQWVGKAREMNIPVDTTPRVGSAAVINTSTYGNVFYVEEILAPTILRVSTYNLNGQGEYVMLNISTNDVSFIHF